LEWQHVYSKNDSHLAGTLGADKRVGKIDLLDKVVIEKPL
jgi:hypothetical protein